MNSDQRAQAALSASATLWFSVTAFGQWLFVAYILSFYIFSLISNNPLAWNQVLPHGYEAGNTAGNMALGSHLIFAALISLLGPMQLIPKLRARVPKLHRWSGRVYVVTAFIMALSGLYLSLSDRKVAGDESQHFWIIINALLILVCAVCALRYAMQRQIVQHRRWALRLFLAVSGVWLFRLGLMAWLLIWQRPVGIDFDTFSGPFLTALAFCVYVLPVLLLEVYLRAKDNGNAAFRYSTAVGIGIITLLMAIGLFGAVAGMWFPRVVT